MFQIFILNTFMLYYLNMITIYDLAKMTGFSPPTVSKALNGTGTISKKTRNLIIAAAREKGYEPNITARTLRTRRSKLIGIINNDLYKPYHYVPPFLSTVLSSFKEVIEKEGYNLLLLSNPAEMKQKESSFIGNSRLIDGILILTMKPGQKELSWIRKYDKPCVSVNDYFPGIGIVVTDNRKGGRIAVQHLIDLGHRNIAYLSGPVSRVSLAAKERQQGYHDTLKKNGIKINPALEVRSDTWHARGGYKACAELLKRRVQFTALFTANNYMAFGAIKNMTESGIKVPRDVSVIGFDDGDSLEEYITPSLSTMWQDAVQIGSMGADMLLRKLKGLSTKKTIHIPAELVQRESTKSPKLPHNTSAVFLMQRW